MLKRKATSIWKRSLKDGNGALTTASGALSDTPYSFKTRFEQQPGTNPEELIAAAHAGCFAMALAGQLDAQGHSPESVHSEATVTLARPDGKWTITEVQLDVSARVPGIGQADFERAVEAAKLGCPVSQALRAIKITVNTTLASGAQSSGGAPARQAG